jgi:hypothetical protein
MVTYSTQDVARYTLHNGGGTFISSLGTITRISGDNLIRESSRSWVVAREPSSPFMNLERDINRSGLTAEDVATGAVWDFLRLWHDGGYFGTWVDGDTLYIDHVEFLPYGHALEVARIRGEKAIYNLITKATVTL